MMTPIGEAATNGDDVEALGDIDEVTERALDTLAQDYGVLRAEHGGRLLVLYGRGVAAVEVAPRGAVI
jgi:hypothetical protein